MIVWVYWRLCWDAPTDMTHGVPAGEPTVAGAGPELPFDVATEMPAARAFRNATESMAVQGSSGEVEPME